YQPLDDQIRHDLDAEYVAFHDEYIQYIEPDDVRPWNPEQARSRRLPVPSLETSPISRTETIDLSNFAVRVFWPYGERPSAGWPVLVWYHGGGWAVGSIESENDFCTKMCSDANCVVVTVGYRLAPEHPYPVPVEDALEALVWVQSDEGRRVLEINPTKIAIGGTSAGANLSVVTTLKASLLPTSIPIIFQILIVPVIDNTATEETTWAARAKAPWLTPARMTWYRKMYLPDPSQALNWDASPNHASPQLLTKVPRTWLAVAEQDLLAPEALLFAAQLRGAGVNVETVEYEGMTHTILAMNGRRPYFLPGNVFSTPT
ncbi:alpha/beta hydrolase fold-domain-containing protein, partial [Exophiala viscosa]